MVLLFDINGIASQLDPLSSAGRKGCPTDFRTLLFEAEVSHLKGYLGGTFFFFISRHETVR